MAFTALGAAVAADNPPATGTAPAPNDDGTPAWLTREPGWEYAFLLPKRYNPSTGELGFAVPGLIQGAAQAGLDLVTGPSRYDPTRGLAEQSQTMLPVDSAMLLAGMGGLAGNLAPVEGGSVAGMFAGHVPPPPWTQGASEVPLYLNPTRQEIVDILRDPEGRGAAALLGSPEQGYAAWRRDSAPMHDEMFRVLEERGLMQFDPNRPFDRTVVTSPGQAKQFMGGFGPPSASKEERR